MKFTKKLSIIIESGFLGSNLKFTDFNFNPKNPNNLKDLGNYIIMIYQILYAERNGLQIYTKQKLNLQIAYDNELIKEPILNEFIDKINSLLNKQIKPAEAKKQINQKNKFDISDSLFTKIKKDFIIELSIINTYINPKDEKSHIIKINPFDNYDWIRNVLHEKIHIVINPKTVLKFSNKKFGGFDNPIGYSHKELLQEISALITDVNLSNFNEFNFEEDEIEKIKDTGKIVNFPENSPDSVTFPFFLHILRNTIVFNHLKTFDKKSVKRFFKNVNTIDKEEIKSDDINIIDKKNELSEDELNQLNYIKIKDSINKEILNKEQKVKWDDIKNYFKKYPYFQKILDRTKSILIKNKIKGITSEEVSFNPKYFNNNFYSFIDKIIFSFMQKSHTFLTKKNEKIGKDEGKLADFLQHVKNCINSYNKTI